MGNGNTKERMIPASEKVISNLKLTNGVRGRHRVNTQIVLAAISGSLLVLGPCVQQFHERGGVLNTLLGKLCDLGPHQS